MLVRALSWVICYICWGTLIREPCINMSKRPRKLAKPRSPMRGYWMRQERKETGWFKTNTFRCHFRFEKCDPNQASFVHHLLSFTEEWLWMWAWQNLRPTRRLLLWWMHQDTKTSFRTWSQGRHRYVHVLNWVVHPKIKMVIISSPWRPCLLKLSPNTWNFEYLN